MTLSFLLFLLPLMASANIWDNLYSGDGVPYELPYNFAMSLIPFNETSHLRYDILTSTKFNSVSMNLTAETTNGTVVLSQMKFQFNKGHIYAYNEKKGCLMVHDDTKLKFDFYQQAEGLLELLLVLNSRDMVDGYKKVDVSDIIKVLNISACVEKVNMYFLNDKELSKIETLLVNGTSTGVNVLNMTVQNPPFAEFNPRPEWKCKIMKTIEIDGTDFVIEVDSDDSDSDVELRGLRRKASKTPKTRKYPLSDVIWEYMDVAEPLFGMTAIGDDNLQGLQVRPNALRQLYSSIFSCKPNSTTPVFDEL